MPPLTFAAVANRSAGTGACVWPRQYPNNIFASDIANRWVAFVGGSIAAVATDNVWHSGIAVFSSTAGQSVVRLDGTETTGTTAPSTAAGALIPFWGAASTMCAVSEVIAWDNYAMTAPERVVFGNNQKAFWGTP